MDRHVDRNDSIDVTAKGAAKVMSGYATEQARRVRIRLAGSVSDRRRLRHSLDSGARGERCLGSEPLASSSPALAIARSMSLRGVNPKMPRKIEFAVMRLFQPVTQLSGTGS